MNKSYVHNSIVFYFYLQYINIIKINKSNCYHLVKH